MAYVDDNLLPGEIVNYRANLHWMTFTTPILVVLAAIVILIAASVPAGALLVLVAMILAFLRGLTYVSSEFAITDKRVLIKVGVLRRRTIELLLSKVETIGVDQSILGRMLNYGNIIVTGTGGTKEPFKGITNPLEFRRQVQSALT
jgi:uncharacterized membrane protein YdbT with pleckstrin-like domain